MLDLNRDISLRVIGVLLPSGETETLITNLFCLPYGHFIPLYFRRCQGGCEPVFHRYHAD